MAISTGETHRTMRQDMAAAGGPTSNKPEVLLDRLPPELLLHIFGWLDWLSLVALESVSVRCRGAVALYLGGLRLFTVDRHLWKELCAVQRPGLLPRMAGPMSQTSEPSSALTALLSKMVNLSELHVDVNSSGKDLLAAVVSASRHWLLLDRLELTWYMIDPPDRDLLCQLCTSCGQLTSVTLDGCSLGDDDVKAVVTKLPALRTLRVGPNLNQDGSFLSQLPTHLHSLSVTCDSFHSWPLSDLLRCRELRSLELQSFEESLPPEQAAQLVSVLVGCVHLERLSLSELDEAFVACLPPDGLPTLRHLTMESCYLNDADFGRLVERLPGLESVSLGGYYSLTPQGLAPLGRLPSLRALRLNNPECVSDWLLTQLSAAPLVELELSAEPLLDGPTCTRLRIRKTLTVDGLLHLTRHCKSLRVLVLSARITGREERISISCGAGVQERDVEQSIRLFVDRVARRLYENDVARQNQ